MAIKTSGPINFQDIVDEFGGADPAKLSEYYRGGGLVPNTNANKNIATSGGALKLSQFYGARKEIFIRMNLQGGGGSGGNGLADGNGTGTNDAGTDTIFRILNGSANIVRASGGSGGGHGNAGAITGSSGGSSDFGAGGSGGAANAAAPYPTFTHYGAGGGGGGGDDGSTSYFNLYGSDAAGNAGSGGRQGARVEEEKVIDVEVTYEIILGSGGIPSEYGNYKGAPGVPGTASFSTSIDDFAQTYTALPPGDGSQYSHYTQDTKFYLRIARNGTIYFETTAP
jgi:hypothetical protein